MADTTVRGRFVWHELITPDTAGAHLFYTKVVGWKTQTWERDPAYTMFVAPSGPLGGSVGRPSESAARWLPYIGTEHIEGTVDQARSLGARVVTDVTEMPNGGKYAVLEDPQGAAFGVYVSASDPSPASEPKLGEYSWHELATDDYRAAFEFYSALFGWEAIAEHDMGAPLGAYFTFGRNGIEMGGMFKRMADMPGGPSWLGYVRVKDVERTVKKAASAGGTVVLGPMEVPGGDFVAQFNDPQGGTFAVHTLAADMKRAARAAEVPAPESGAAGAESSEEQAAAAGATRREAGRKAASKTAKKPAAKKAKRAAKTKAKPAAKKASGKSAGARKSTKKKAKSATKKAAKKAASRKVARGGARKGPAAKKRGTAARGAKRPARKVARGAKGKKSTKTRASAKKRSGKARKAK